MRKYLFISAAALVCPAAFAADPSLVVSAGEHGEFSRVVVAGGAPDLTIETAGRVIRLRNINETTQVDLADINNGQKAHRIETARRASPEVIELQMNCDCAVRTVRAPDGNLVIDIADQTDAILAEYTSGEPTQLINLSAETGAETKQAARDDTLTVAQAHDRIMDLLQQAADDGLINLKVPSNTGEPTEKSDAGPVTRQEPAPEPEAPADMKMAAHSTSSSPTQTAVQPTLAAAPAAAPARQCFSDKHLEIDGSDFEADPLIEIEALEARLVEATGDEKKIAARKLAAGFLAIGFGEEAIAVLKDIDKPDSPMSEIAQIVAERSLDANGALLGANNCTGAHALWQAVATEDATAAALYERSGAAIETLPTRLKTLILGRLAVKMADLEAWDAAQSLLQIADAYGENHSPEFKYVRIRLADHEAKEETTRASLLEVATDESSASDEALLALAESYAKQGGVPHEGFTEDIGALAKIGGSSRAAFFEAYSWAEAGNLDAALLLLKNEAPKSPDNAEMAGATASGIISRAFAGDDSLLKVSALEAFLKNEDWIDPENARRNLRSNAADFAYELGLPNLSYALLANIRTAPDRNMSKQLAKSALAAGAPGEAIKYAAPFATEAEFGALIAEANIKNGDYHAALATAATINDEQTQARLKSRAGWLSRNWQAARDGFRRVDPSKFDDAAAIQYGLTAYITGEASLPGAVDAALSAQAATIKAGLQSLFVNKFEGTTLERARSISEATKKEISAFEEILSDG